MVLGNSVFVVLFLHEIQRLEIYIMCHLVVIFIQSSFQLNYYKIHQFLVMEKLFPTKDTKRTMQTANLLSRSHTRLVFTTDVEVIALNSSADFPT